MNDYKQRYIYFMFTTIFHIAIKVYQGTCTMYKSFDE